MRRPRLTFVIAAMTCFALISASTLADQWAPPGDTVWYGQDRAFRFAVFPRILSSAADYWHTYDRGPGKRGQAEGQRDVCIGQLEKREADGTYTLAWKRELVNDVSPVSALVTADGSHVVTFDNWHSRGYGTDVVVIYGPTGTLVKSLGLADFLTKDRVAALPRSVSSIGWGGVHHLDAAEEHVVLEVKPARERDADEKVERPSVVISLHDGRVVQASSL